MQNFVFQSPTKVIFGKNVIEQIGSEAKKLGKKVLFVHDKNATSMTGIYETIVQSLKAAGLDFIEYTEIRPNPVLSQVREGVEIAKREKIDLVIGAGGGSAIDEAKAIAAGACVDHDVWDFFTGKAAMEQALPVISVITKSATGTETNGGSVIMNEETNEKYGIILPPLFPKVAFMDPTVTFTVPPDQTAYGAVDAISHLLEGYLTNTDPETPTINEYAEGLIRTIIAATDRIMTNPKDYEARAAFMWTAALAWNGLVLAGIGSCGYPNHLIGHSMSALFGVQHGASISISFSGWMPYFVAQSKNNAAKMAYFGKQVFGIENSDAEIAAKKTVEAFCDWCKKIGAPTTLAEIGINGEGLVKIAENAALCSAQWGMPEYTEDVIAGILRSCH